MSTALDLPGADQVGADQAEVDGRWVDLNALYAESNIGEVIGQLDNDLVGLVPVKTRIREVAALLLVESARRG